MNAPVRLEPRQFVRRRWVAYLDAGDLPAGSPGPRLLEIIENYTPEIEWLGAGRFYLDLSASVRLLGHPLDSVSRLGRELRRAGFSARAGLSFNKFLARSSAVPAGRGGAFWLLPQGAGDFLEALPLGSWPGLREEEVRFWRGLGMETAADLGRVDLFWMRRAGGLRGVAMSRQARGFDPRPVIRRLPGAGPPPPAGRLFPPGFKEEKLRVLSRLAAALRNRYGRRAFPRTPAR